MDNVLIRDEKKTKKLRKQKKNQQKNKTKNNPKKKWLEKLKILLK